MGFLDFLGLKPKQPLVENLDLLDESSSQGSHVVSAPTGSRIKGAKQLREERELTSALTGVYTRLHSNKAEYKRLFRDLQTYYLVDAILNQLAEDSLTPDITTGEVVTLTSDDERVRLELEDLQSKINLDQLVNDFIMDLLENGDYYLRIQAAEGQGVTAIIDDVDQDNILGLYDKGLPSKFLIKSTKQIRLVAPYHYAHFVLGKSKLRIKLSDFIDGKLEGDTGSYRLPTYVRVGRPVLYGVINKLKELLLLEKLIPAAKINQLSSGNLVSVGLPAHTTPEKAFDVARQVEQVLNQKIGVNKSTSEMTVTDIISTAGRVKVIPSFGDKGSLGTVDAKNDRTADDLTASVKDLREIICSSVGIPYAILFGGDGNKSEILRKYARYLRRLKTIQSSISNGLMQIALIHLINKGISATPADVKIEFRNEIVNIDELDKLEYHDAILGMTEKVIELGDNLSKSAIFQGAVNPEELVKAVKSIMSLSSSLNNVLDPEKIAGKSLNDLVPKEGNNQ